MCFLVDVVFTEICKFSLKHNFINVSIAKSKYVKVTVKNSLRNHEGKIIKRTLGGVITSLPHSTRCCGQKIYGVV